MSQFTIPQRKAYVEMLTKIRSRVASGFWYSYPARESRERQLAQKFKLAKFERQLAEVKAKIEAGMEELREQYDREKAEQIEDLSLAIAEVWRCETADAAKSLVEPFIKGIQFSD